MRKLAYGSVCSGISAESVAWGTLGWSPAWFSETAPFPSAVLAHRHPGVPNLWDANRAHEREEFHQRKIDILVGGTPCQSFSQAGNRKGFADARGQLALRFLEIAGMLQPRWLVWENVPEALSSNGGGDFAAFIGKMGGLGYGYSWHVLDSLDFGVPQARRRLFVIGHLGGWQRAAAIFSGREVVRQDRRQDGGEGHAHAREDGAGAEGPIPIQGNLIGRGDGAGPQGPGWRKGPMFTLTAMDRHAVVSGGIARYLLPVEAERLQGFPDDYTKIPFAGKTAALCPDGPRYEAVGNAMCVPVMRWLGERIAFFDSLPDEQVASFLCVEDFARTLPDADLVDRCVRGFRRLKEIVPYLREARDRWAQPGRRVPVPGEPTWTEWVEQNLGVSVRTVQRVLRDALEPGDTMSRGRPKQQGVRNWRSQLKTAVSRMGRVFGPIKDEQELAEAIRKFGQALADRYAGPGRMRVGVSMKGK